MGLAFYQSPFGDVKIKEQNGFITDIAFVGHIPSPRPQQASPLLNKACRQLDEYFAGTRKKFDLPIAPRGSLFQQKVWLALQNIEYGSTKTYADIACQIGKPKAYRAVGQANNKNPVAIVVPCHRVIGKSGRLTGYAAGLDIKQKLLDLEQKYK